MEKNYNIVEAAVKQNGLGLNDAHYDMKNEYNIVMTAVKQDGKALQFAHDDLKSDFNIVMAAVKQDGMALQYSHDNLKKNYNIVDEAVKQNGYALQYVHDDILKNYDIVETAVKQNGRALQYAHDDFKRNYDFVEVAVKQSLHALQYAHESSIIRNQVVSPIILKAIKDDPDGRLVFHELVGDKTRANIIKILVKADRSFVDLMDDDGRRAIDRAVPDCKLAIELALCLFEKFDVLSDTPIIHKSPTTCVFKALDKANESFVALKCVKNRHQVLAEIEGREGLLEDSRIIKLNAVYVDSSIIDYPELEEASKDNDAIEIFPNIDNLGIEIDCIISNKEILSQGLTKTKQGTYNYVLVFEYGESTFDSVLKNLSVDPSSYQMKMFFMTIVNALMELHVEGRIHADLKPTSLLIVRLNLMLIDLDVSCKIGECYGSKLPSTAYCPPEVAKSLFDGDLQSFKAAISHDLFSLGVILYQMESGENKSLWHADKNDNIDEYQRKELTYAWQKRPFRNKKLKRVQNEIARDLIERLLDPDPNERIAHFCKDYDGIRQHGRVLNGVLKHAYISDKTKMINILDHLGENIDKVHNNLNTVEEKVSYIRDDVETLLKLSVEHNDELKRTRNILIHAVYEADEVKTPTTFVLLENEIPESFSNEKEEKFLQMILGGDGSNFKVIGERRDQLNSLIENMEQARTLVKSFTESSNESNSNTLFTPIKKIFGQLATAETLYFYLIDELTGEPVKGEGYPIEIKKSSEFVPTMMPFIECGMRAMSLYNGTAGICRMFGFPFPKVPDSILSDMKEDVLILKQKNSVEAYNAVSQKVEDGDDRSKTVRGSDLKELEKFFEKYDKDKTYAGLRRIAGDDGGAIWTAVPDEFVGNQLEYRAKQREYEECQDIKALLDVRRELIEKRQYDETQVGPRKDCICLIS